MAMYFGSVRFFKNLILLAVVVLIAVPTVLAVRYAVALDQREAELLALRESQPPAPSALPSPEPEPEQTDDPPAPSPSEGTDPDLPYQSMYPDFYAPEPYHATQRNVNTIYLTFDDGPSVNTTRLLSILAENDVQATFFVTGVAIESNPQALRDIAEQGHTLGMHSYSHNYSQIYVSVEAFLEDMYQVFTLIRDETGTAPTMFRFPGGSINSYNAGIYQELIAEMVRRGFVPYDWNLSAEDAVNRAQTTEQIVENVMGKAAQVERGFVLLHDSAGKSGTVTALPDIITQLRDLGFEFEAIAPDTKPVLFGYKE